MLAALRHIHVLNAAPKSAAQQQETQGRVEPAVLDTQQSPPSAHPAHTRPHGPQ